MAGKGSGGCLAIRSGNAHGLALQEWGSQFQVADDADPAGAGVIEEIEVRWHARRNHHQVRTVKSGFGLWLDCDSQNFSCSFFVYCANGRAMFAQQLHRSDTGPRHPDHDNFQTIKFQRSSEHRSLWSRLSYDHFRITTITESHL